MEIQLEIKHARLRHIKYLEETISKLRNELALSNIRESSAGREIEKLKRENAELKSKP